MSAGVDAERHVEARVRAALPPPFALYANVRWTWSQGSGRPAEEGEADLVVAHPGFGVLVVEVKAGVPSRDARGRWFLGSLLLEESPFAQAEGNVHALMRALTAQPGWLSGTRPCFGHAVAFPGADLASLPPGHVLLGPDADQRIVLDARALETAAATHEWVERAFAFYAGDGSRGTAMGEAGMRLIDQLLTPTVALHRQVRGRIFDDAPLLVSATRQQMAILSQTRTRRVEVIGPAGSGKSMLAAEKARRLAAQGYRTLLVCYNQPLATAMVRDLADDALAAERAGGGLVVATFHRLAELLGVRAGAIAPHGPRLPDGWFASLPGALATAIEALPDERFHAVVVDEGQDFDAEWLLLLEQLLRDPDEGVLWVFHDPGQAVRCPDVVGQLRLGECPLYLYQNLRNPGPIAALASRFYRGGEEVLSYRQLAERPSDVEGRLTVIAAERGRQTVEAVRKVLHRLLVDEDVRSWDVAVLSGTSAVKSEVWAHRRFGNAELWNGSINDDGSSRGLAPEDVPDEPPENGIVRFETVRRFKGLERPVVVLCELPTEGDRLDELLYSALTRPTTQLVVVAPPALAERMR